MSVTTGIFGLFPKPILWMARKLVPGEGVRDFRSPLVAASAMDAPELQVLEAQREAEHHHELGLKMMRELETMMRTAGPHKKGPFVGPHQ